MAALEFFSGIGAFANAATSFSVNIASAYDQSELANLTYSLNYKQVPDSKNLDSIKSQDIVPGCDLWWMSPPCTPFSVRGKQADAADNRAKAFLNLISLIPQMVPTVILIENVVGFAQSAVHHKLQQCLSANGYTTAELQLNSLDFGVPMRRPRYFVIAVRGEKGEHLKHNLQVARRQLSCVTRLPLSQFINPNLNKSELFAELAIAPEQAARFRAATDIVVPHLSDATVICFTRGYYDCRRASGSLIELPDGSLRRFAPEEILQLLGFEPGFAFPAQLSMREKLRLVGNSVDVRVIKFLLALLGTPQL